MEIVEFNALFRRFKHSAFRLEARDTYDVAFEREGLDAFLTGRPVPPRSPEAAAWLELVAAATASGRRIERVRIVSRPLNAYTQFELSAYRDNVSAGERIRVLDRAFLSATDMHWASKDFWIFDERTVVLLDYNDRGRFLGVKQAAPAGEYLRAQGRALELAVRLDCFVGPNPKTHQSGVAASGLGTP